MLSLPPSGQRHVRTNGRTDFTSSCPPEDAKVDRRNFNGLCHSRRDVWRAINFDHHAAFCEEL